jgi:glycerophosphoryl diester phosphodiesterase
MTDAFASSHGRVSRRTFLAGLIGAAITATAGCQAKELPPPATVNRLIAGTPFYIAHRGGGDNWPEMTAYAYEQAAKLPGLLAIEISVCCSADGVLVCSHDPTTQRLTGVPYTIASEPWATLSKLKVTSSFTLDPSQPSRPLSRFDEVIEQHIGRFVAFVEPKTPGAVQPLMEKMASLNQPERVVWKQPINQPNFGTAKSHGFATWGYVLNEPGHLGDNLRQFAATPAIDMLGAQRSQPDSSLIPVIDEAAAYGKETIMWNIRNADDRTRALRLGCQGMMTSNIAQVPGIPL